MFTSTSQLARGDRQTSDKKKNSSRICRRLSGTMSGDELSKCLSIEIIVWRWTISVSIEQCSLSLSPSLSISLLSSPLLSSPLLSSPLLSSPLLFSLLSSPLLSSPLSLSLFLSPSLPRYFTSSLLFQLKSLTSVVFNYLFIYCSYFYCINAVTRQYNILMITFENAHVYCCNVGWISFIMRL